MHPGASRERSGGIVMKTHMCTWLDCFKDGPVWRLVCECLVSVPETGQHNV